MKDNEERLIFCKRCRKFKPMEGSAWDFVHGGFICNSCCKLMLKMLSKEEPNE